MMTSSRPRDVGNSFANRRGHSNKLSISDSSHHVTEAIGNLYDDEDDYASPQDTQRQQPPATTSNLPRPADQRRPLSFIASPQQDQLSRTQLTDSPASPDDARRPLLRSTSDMSGLSANGNQQPSSPMKAQTLPTRIPSKRSNSYNDSSPKSPLSPSLSLRDMQEDAAGTQFPLTNIDNPNDIAQELSNLQKLRRMSMDVGNNSALDPDMLPFSGMSLMAMPSIAPTGGDDEGDPSRLLWVPARVHPELAPMEFKSFLENRVQSIKRRSGESFLSAGEISDLSSSGGSSGSLRRKKSMLSRQIDNSGGNAAVGYVDGAERLERKRSSSGGLGSTPELSLEELANDPSKAIQKLTLETQHPGGEGAMEDMPILPVVPGMGLRRSTRTTYRKGGSLRGERLPFSKRVAARQAEAEAQETLSPQSPPGEPPKGHGLARIQTEPIPENYSRPTPRRSVRRQQKFSQDSVTSTTSTDEQEIGETVSATSPTRPHQDVLSVRSPASDASSPVPQIVEPEADDDDDEGATQPQPARPFPQRSSSQKASQQMMPQGTSQQSQQYPADEPPAKSNRRPAAARAGQTSPAAQQAASKSAHDTPGQSQSIPVDSRVNRTDSLTFIPTYTTDDRKEKRGKKDKDDDSGSVSSSKSSWKWFKGSTDDKKKKEEEGKKSKAKTFVERAHDNVRLDVLQTSIENAVTKGRESLLLDRESIDNKLHEERKKESNRKSDGKKEKDGNLLSFLGLGSKRKSDKESSEKKKGQHLRVSDDHEKVYRPLRPDVDYHWTRFPLLEERAIYRMAHIKLANPRRSLHSQVLLSNFMYNYLAIVQAMHPQMQVPVSPQQKRLAEEERKKKEAEQQAYLAEQQMLQNSQQQDGTDHYNYDYHRGANHGQYGEAQSDEVEYMDDAQIYEYEHGDQDDYDDQHNGYGQHDGQQKDYYGYGGHNGDDGREYQGGGSGRDDMW